MRLIRIRASTFRAMNTRVAIMVTITEMASGLKSLLASTIMTGRAIARMLRDQRSEPFRHRIGRGELKAALSVFDRQIYKPKTAAIKANNQIAQDAVTQITQNGDYCDKEDHHDQLHNRFGPAPAFPSRSFFLA